MPSFGRCHHCSWCHDCSWCFGCLTNESYKSCWSCYVLLVSRSVGRSAVHWCPIVGIYHSKAQMGRSALQRFHSDVTTTLMFVPFAERNCGWLYSFCWCWKAKYAIGSIEDVRLFLPWNVSMLRIQMKLFLWRLPNLFLKPYEISRIASLTSRSQMEKRLLSFPMSEEWLMNVPQMVSLLKLLKHLYGWLTDWLTDWLLCLLVLMLWPALLCSDGRYQACLSHPTFKKSHCSSPLSRDKREYAH